MEESEKETNGAAALAEERLRLEREATAVVLLSLLCFAGGLIAGLAISESRQQKLREERLARALSQLGDIAEVTTSTNSAAAKSDARSPGGAHKNVAVMVIQ